LFFLLLLVHITVTRGHLVGSDELNVYQTTRALFEQGELAVGFTRNVAAGPDGRYYSIYNVGLAVIALPLYAIGAAVGTIAQGLGLDSWVAVLEGNAIGREPWRFGGDVEIFFVGLTNAVLTAWLCVVFYRASLLLGGRPAPSVAASLALGTATYVAPFSSGLLRHTAEALFLLAAVFHLMRDAREPSRRDRWWAGVMMGLLVQCRLVAAISLPALLGFSLYAVWQRSRRVQDLASSRRIVIETLVPVALPLLVSVAFYWAVNWIKFGSAFGHYGDGIESRFEKPLFDGLYAFALSPGASLFVFTPLLLASPWAFRWWSRRRLSEVTMVLTVAGAYLLLFSKFSDWHGLPTALGPRYLMAIVPLLLLPLAGWSQTIGRRVWLVLGVLVAIGLVVQAVHMAVSYGSVHHDAGYETYQPSFGYMFRLEDSPLVAHFRVLRDAPHFVDLWLVTVYRNFGLGRLALLGLPLLALLVYCGVKLMHAIRELGIGRSDP